jgi:hypothetical protein
MATKQWSIPQIPLSDPAQQAREWMGQASGSYARMGQKTTTKGPGKTFGGGLMGAAGGALTATTLGSAMGTGALAGAVGGPIGIAVGAALGLGAYLFS